MKPNKRTIILSVTKAFLASVLFLQFAHAASPGRSAANFLKIGMGARGAAMGDAQTAIADDLTAAYWNPAQAVFRSRPGLSAGYKRLSLGRNQQFFGYNMAIPPRAGLCAALISHGDAEVAVYDQDEKLIDEHGLYIASDLMLGLGFKVNRRLALGVGTQVMYETLGDVENRESVVDAGNLSLAAFYRLSSHLAAGAHLMNLAVRFDHRGRGTGRALALAAFDLAAGLGARRITLEVRPSNHVALRLYERYGFERIGVRRGYYPAHGGREDAIVMRIPL